MFEKLSKIVGEENILENEPMSLHTTFRVGGPARYFVTVNSETELLVLLKFLKQKSVEYYILGNGSNLLVSDEGYSGVVIQLAGEFDIISVSDNKIIAGSGILLCSVAARAMAEGLTGMEFASGIPGTIGGAVLMNAGAYEGEMKQIISSVRILWIDDAGDFPIENVNCENMKFGYRTSILKERRGIVLAAKLTLEYGDKEKIKEKTDELNGKRREKQPLEYPSAGSTFKRPEGHFAGKLISDAGLKGYSIGMACVSEKHAGFIINKGGARAREIRELIDYVIKVVKEKYDVELEPEIIFLGNTEK